MTSQIKHIALADDDKDDVETFQLALNEVCTGINLHVASNGEELLDILDCSPFPDVIILDINMPLRSGIYCLHSIRLRKMFDRVPVIMLSAIDNEEDIDYCLSHGAGKYFTKPPEFSAFKKLIEEICFTID